jgi:hypothetical protein
MSGRGDELEGISDMVTVLGTEAVSGPQEPEKEKEEEDEGEEEEEKGGEEEEGDVQEQE